MFEFFIALVTSYFLVSLLIFAAYTYLESKNKYPCFRFMIDFPLSESNREIMEKFNNNYSFQKSQIIVFWLPYLLLFLRFGIEYRK